MRIHATTKCWSSSGSAGAEGDRALRAAGGTGFFDVLEMFDDEALVRLRHYAGASPDRPSVGFWTEEDIEARFA